MSRGTFIGVLLARGSGALLTFAMVIVVGRGVPIGAAGLVLFGWASVQFAASLLRCGGEVVVLRTTSQAFASGELERARGVIVQTAAIALTAAVVFSAVVVLARAQVAEWFFDADAGSLVLMYALCVPPLVASLLAVEVLKGCDGVALGSFCNRILRVRVCANQHQ